MSKRVAALVISVGLSLILSIFKVSAPWWVHFLIGFLVCFTCVLVKEKK